MNDIPTPLTDEAAKQSGVTGRHEAAVSADFALQLETELAETRKELAESKRERDKLRNAIAGLAQLVGVSSNTPETMIGSVETKFVEKLEDLATAVRDRSSALMALKTTSNDRDAAIARAEKAEAHADKVAANLEDARQLRHGLVSDVASLRAQLEAAKSEWLPIETAPKEAKRKARA